MKTLSTGSNAAIAGALAGVQARIMEDLDGYQATPDQEEWRGRVDLHFQRIYQVLAGIGTPDTLTAAEWESSRNWASVYIVLFMAIDAALPDIRDLLAGKLDPEKIRELSASKIIGEVMQGHYFFWLSRAHKGEWTFPVKSIRDGLRKAKKLENSGKEDDSDSFITLYKQVSSHAVKRIGSEADFFAPHIICLLAFRAASKRSRNARRWVNAYDLAMAELAKTTAQGLREGSAQGFGFRSGQRLQAAPGGTYKPVNEEGKENA